VGFGYRKSFKAGPFRVTASKSGISYSAGVKGARVTKRANGRVQTTLSVPGTGLSYTSTSGRKAKTAGRQSVQAPRPAPVRAVKRGVASHPRPGPTRMTRQHPASRLPQLPGQRSSIHLARLPALTNPLTIKGYLAKITLLPDRIQIDRSFFGRISGNRSATIYWSQLVGIDFLDPARLTNGHMHFAVADDPRGLTATGRGNRLAAAARNPHAIMFTWQQRAAYEQLRAALEAAAVSP
jgi:hypothetical protein